MRRCRQTLKRGGADALLLRGGAGVRIALERPTQRGEIMDHVICTLGVDLSTQRLPLSERYVYLDRFRQRLTRASTEIGRWDVQEERVAGLDMLRELSRRFREQNQIFASRVGASGHAARVQTRVWAALERATI